MIFKMEPPSIENVHRAIYALYNNNNVDPSEQESASVWLGEVQKSVYSWKIADELLHEKRDLESCYFAAQTMRSKIKYSFKELPIEAHESLRASLFEHIKKITPETNSVIVTQLCLALVDLAVQMVSWNNIIESLIDELSKDSSWALLEILTVLPEEVNSENLKVYNWIDKLIRDIRHSFDKVTNFMKTIQGSAQILIKSIKCMTSWLSFKMVGSQAIVDNFMIAQCFAILSDCSMANSLHEAATDCVCAMIRCFEYCSNFTLNNFVYTSVVSLDNYYHLSVANEDQEKSFNYSRIFTEFAETFLFKIVEGTSPGQTHFTINILNSVLMCVGHHDYEIAEMSFGMWYTLSEMLYGNSNDDSTTVFKPYIERLIAALCRHCQMDPDNQGILEEGDDCYDFRLKVIDLIKDIVFIAGSSNCFRQMFLSLQSSSASWEQIEAPLFIMHAVAKSILPEENEVVPKVIEAILAMPNDTHPAVKKTCILLLGELCEWIDKHPEYLQSTLEFLLSGLQDIKLATTSARALQYICAACRNHMPVHLSGLFHIMRFMETFQLNPEAALGLLKGVAAIIGGLPPDQVTTAMREICSIQLIPLAALASNEAIEIKKEIRNSQSDPVLWLDRISALFSHVGNDFPEGSPHPCLPVLSDCWPVLSATMDRFSKDGRVMERLCRCLRFAVRCVRIQAIPLLQPLVTKMIVIYENYKHSCFLYLGSILVDEFAINKTCIPGLMSMLMAFMEPTFQILQNEHGFKYHPDTVDDMFRLCDRFLQRSPECFLESPAMSAIVQCALLATFLDHRDANSSVMTFFTDLIHTGASKSSGKQIKQKFNEIIHEHGEALVRNLINASVFQLQSSMLYNVCGVMCELYAWNGPLYNEWLKTALSQMPQPSRGCVLPEQISQFHESVKNPESVREMTQNLKHFAKLYC